MKLELKIMTALCDTLVFTINGVNAEYEDFGTKFDRDSENAEEYGCGDMRFERHPSDESVLEKYSISEEEYSEICDKLEEGLSFGCCGWCI